MKKFFSIFIFASLIAACKKEVSSVSIRVENQTAFDITNVSPTAAYTEFEYVKSGSVTDYRTFPKAVSDPSVYFMLNGEKINVWYEFLVFPGYLKPGCYTLEITKESAGYQSKLLSN